jgi:cytosine/adenosine deaminase-related metal-dependent hydrolase
MNFKKLTGNSIFDGYKMLTGKNVLITDEAGIIVDVADIADAGDDIEFYDGMLCPGFINVHCHLELSHLKGLIQQQTGLPEFILKIVGLRHIASEKINEAIANAEEEMFNNGIVAVGDICNTASTIFQKKKGKILYHNFIELSGVPPYIALERFDRANEMLKEFYRSNDEWRISLVPHAPYSVSPELFGLINNGTANQIISIHNQETASENELFEQGTGGFMEMFDNMNIDRSFFKHTGKSSLQTWLPYFNNNQSLILVHNIATSEKDMEFLTYSPYANLHSTFLCLCPNANLYISNTLPDVNLLMEQNVNIVLGTDSLASNHQLSIWEEIKTLQSNFPNLSFAILLKWATINGAKALGMDDFLGSFEKGKQPGVLVLEGMNEACRIGRNKAKRII